MLDFIYDESGKPLAVRDSHDGGSTFATYYYVLNLQGDVVKLIGASGTVYANYQYNAWGELLSVTNASGNVITDYSHISHVNPLRYRGYYYDRETGWYYLQSRYYDPVMHRFINADTFASTGQGLLGCNMFAYCNNNPVAFADNEGDYCTYVVQETGGGGVVNPALRDVTDEVNAALLKAATEGKRRRALVDESLQGNMARLFLYAEFYRLVNHEAPWDIKRAKPWADTIGTEFPGKDVPVIYDGMVMTPESLGNFTYGYLGNAYGISGTMLIGGSYYAADFPTGGALLQNEISDWRYIMLGYSYYRQGYFSGG